MFLRFTNTEISNNHKLIPLNFPLLFYQLLLFERKKFTLPIAYFFKTIEFPIPVHFVKWGRSVYGQLKPLVSLLCYYK